MQILLNGLQQAGSLGILSSLRSSLGSEVRRPVKIPMFHWSPERVFISTALYERLIRGYFPKYNG